MLKEGDFGLTKFGAVERYLFGKVVVFGELFGVGKLRAGADNVNPDLLKKGWGEVGEGLK